MSVEFLQDESDLTDSFKTGYELHRGEKKNLYIWKMLNFLSIFHERLFMSSHVGRADESWMSSIGGQKPVSRTNQRTPTMKRD